MFAPKGFLIKEAKISNVIGVSPWRVQRTESTWCTPRGWWKSYSPLGTAPSRRYRTADTRGVEPPPCRDMKRNMQRKGMTLKVVMKEWKKILQKYTNSLTTNNEPRIFLMNPFRTRYDFSNSIARLCAIYQGFQQHRSYPGDPDRSPAMYSLHAHKPSA